MAKVHALILFICSYVLVQNVFALDLELTQGINSAIPIGIDSFGGDESARQVSEVIAHDLQGSGQFKLIPTPMGLAQGSAGLGLWRHAGADNVLMGQVTHLGGNRYAVRFSLMDPVAQQHTLLAQSFQVNGAALRALAHHISDLAYEKLTGEKGIFSTRIAYVLVQRMGDQTRYTLEVADADGFNPQSLLVSSEPIMSPSWSPDGKQIAYVSFEKKTSQIYIVSVETGARRLITSFAGINGAPSWSKDGHKLAVVLSKSGSPKIYGIDLSNGQMKQLTFGDAIDTEPRFSPDGQSLLFTSGRGGRPQIYRLNLQNGQINRVTFEGNYNARASFTPNQKQIVMLHREDKHFSIAVQDLESGRVTPVSSGALDESPSVSPNGRLVLYATRIQDKGVLGVVSLDGRIHMRLPSREGDVQEPAWSPFL